MAVALDAVSSANFVTNGAGTAINLTVSSSATSMLVMLSMASTNPGTTTVSWDSSTQFLTQLAVVNSTAGSSNSQCSLWGLLSPHPGNFFARALWVNNISAAIEVFSFFNTPTDTIANCFPHTSSGTGVSQLPSVTITSQSSDMALGLFASISTVDSVDNTQVYIQNTNACKSGANRSSGQASITLGASIAASAAWVSAAVDVAAAAGSAATSIFGYGNSWTSTGRVVRIIGTG